MAHRLDLRIDVAAAIGLLGRAEVAVTVHLPNPAVVAEAPVAMFLYPGGGFSRGYFQIEHPRLQGYNEAAFHVSRGRVVVACDYLGAGESVDADSSLLSYEVVAAGNDHAARQVIDRLESGTMLEGYPRLHRVRAVGAGQSLGGCILTVQQARHRTFSSVAMLGWSAIRQGMTPAPEQAPTSKPSVRRGDDAVRRMSMEDFSAYRPGDPILESFRHAFHWEDQPAVVVDENLGNGFPSMAAEPPMWSSRTMPIPIAATSLSAGCVADEAAMIDVPLFLGFGERDSCRDPWSEATAYRSARDITLVVLPRSGHMHNFASTRAQFWQRIETWIDSTHPEM